MFFFKINVENEQESYFMILKKSQFGQMLQICDNGPLRVKDIFMDLHKSKTIHGPRCMKQLKLASYHCEDTIHSPFPFLNRKLGPSLLPHQHINNHNNQCNSHKDHPCHHPSNNGQGVVWSWHIRLPCCMREREEASNLHVLTIHHCKLYWTCSDVSEYYRHASWA